MKALIMVGGKGTRLRPYTNNIPKALLPIGDMPILEIILLSENNAAIGQTINIGSNTEISISDTVDLIKELMNSNIKIKHDAQRFRPKNSEVFRLFCDNGKINMLTGYEPRIELKEGIQRTINWILEPNNLKKYKAEIYNL